MGWRVFGVWGDLRDYLLAGSLSVLLALQLDQVLVQLTEALLPDAAVAVHPVGDLFQRGRLEFEQNLNPQLS
jgi:hypothetical protein